MVSCMVFKDGNLYIVSFLDHCTGDSPVTCVCSGWLYKQTKECITLANWIPLNVDRETQEENIECITILKSTIKQYKKVN